MSKCKDCNDTGKYQPLIGPPEPCLACQDPPVYVDGATLERLAWHRQQMREVLAKSVDSEQAVAQRGVFDSVNLKTDISIKTTDVKDAIESFHILLEEEYFTRFANSRP